MTQAAFVNEAETEAPPAIVLWMERVDIAEDGSESVSEPIRTTDKQWFAQYASRATTSPNSFFRLTDKRPAPIAGPESREKIPAKYRD